MEKVLVKVDGHCIFAPTEEQWSGMDIQMKTIVKKVGGLIDFPMKQPLLAEYNTCKVHKKYELMFKNHVPVLLLKDFYPKYNSLHKYQYLNTGADIFPKASI